MPQFLTGTELSAKIESVINKAQKEVVLISPYIKLSKAIKRTLDGLKDYPEIQLVLIFGKNEDDYYKSISADDLDYLRGFPHLEIRYEPDLHAKVYMNEGEIILSSMNLYDYSQHNNIEFGVYGSAKGIIGKIGSSISGESFDEEAVGYFWEVYEKAKILLKIDPEFKEGGIFSKDKYVKSHLKVDDFPEPPVDQQSDKGGPGENKPQGFCIRTGVRIGFNPKQPFSKKAFESWNRFKDENYPEKYCHFSGEPSNGETSFSRPILKKNWAKAMKS